MIAKTGKREEAIAALLSCPSIAEAARVAGISEPTLLRWLKDKEFDAEYRAARRLSVNMAVVRLQQVSSSAVDTLLSIMKDEGERGSVRVSAARSVLEMAFKGMELEDMEQRIEALEEAIAAQEAAA